MAKSPRVCVRLELEPASLAIFRSALAQSKEDVQVTHDLPHGEGPWLIVTDRPAPETVETENDSPRTAALIAVNIDRAADVRLPLDVTPREVSLAVGLCVEIARLRFANQQQSLATDEVRRQAQTDPLTGLANRRAWDANLQRALIQARHLGHGVSLGVVDLDHFKQVNDRTGHPLGDEVLRAAAKALHQSTRAGDLIARLGGDEFAVLLSGIAHDATHAVWERIRTNFATSTGAVAPQPVTCSIGYLWLVPDASTDQETLLATADAALRKAKQAGRNRVVAAEESEMCK